MTSPPEVSVLGPEALLTVWESAAAQHPLDRALTILRAAYPRRSRDELARLTIGERDSLLFGFHANNFGPRLAAQGLCPECNGRVELDLDLRDLSAGNDATRPGDMMPEGRVELQLGDLVVACRAPDSYDLAAVAGAVGGGADLAASRRLLLERCVTSMVQLGNTVATGDLSEEQVDAVSGAVADALETAQPLADLEMLITCPTCGHVWELLLDIVDFVWARIERQTRRLLSEVDCLARAYGWREADILALSPARRQIYLSFQRNGELARG